MNRLSFALATILFLVSSPLVANAQQSGNSQDLWKLENDYWNYVKALDLDGYRKLWHANFVGWPSVSSRPVRKDHITDWIAARTQKGERMESFTLTKAESQRTDNVYVMHYWLTATWSTKEARGNPSTTRITHTWLKTPDGWQIIGGMSAPEPNPVP